MYPHYLAKVEKKGRIKEDLHLVIHKATFEQLFQRATVNPLTQQVRYLDKLVDELAKGRKMEKIRREE